MKKVFKYGVKLVSWLAYPLGFLFPRNKQIWLFGGYNGYNDNTRYLFESANNNESIRCIWISDDKKIITLISNKGYEAYHKRSVRGIFFCYFSKVYLYSNYVSTINFYTSAGATLVNLWHGTPLKKIEYDIKKKPLFNYFKGANLFYKLLMPEKHKKCDVLLAPSNFVYEYSFKNAFRIYDKKNVIIADPPRISSLIDKGNKTVSVKKETKIFLYAPTWRDNSSDFIHVSGLNFSVLDSFLSENDSILELRLHANTNIKVDLENYKNIRIIDNKEPAEESMLRSDFLITDYSSIYFDYLYLDKPVIFFPFDYDEYLSSRDMYLHYDDVIAGAKVYDQNALIYEMNKLLKGDDQYVELRKIIAEKFCSLERRNDLYIIEKIKEYINER
ncbi:CDP-glycerol glycerophosphotransferase family protein [Pseudocitrobacter faecalis]|uniref:CDP-glycerol glycerophosphotransferase family protein n=1 Tax=Pseudocitrobacter faecalis TaxID=1398493 RepID=UPI003899B765